MHLRPSECSIALLDPSRETIWRSSSPGPFYFLEVVSRVNVLAGRSVGADFGNWKSLSASSQNANLTSVRPKDADDDDEKCKCGYDAKLSSSVVRRHITCVHFKATNE